MNTENVVVRELNFKEKLKGRQLSFVTTWGLFSPKKIDSGSKLLIEKMEINLNDRVLDLGCGYGPIGMVAAKLAIDGQVEMVDKDFVAIEYANKNIKSNHLKNTIAYLSNMFDQIDKEKKYDVIVSNIPAKVSKEMFWMMFEDMKKHLAFDGRVYLVALKGLKKFLKRSLVEYFGDCKRVAQEKEYVLFRVDLKKK